jgi:glutamate/tyrosine decarboxylase-like PLP-dependent enzyme
VSGVGTDAEWLRSRFMSPPDAADAAGLSEDSTGTSPPRFDWHPQAELLSFGSPERSHAALDRLGLGTWEAALDYLYDEAMRRAKGPDSYPDLRRAYFGPTQAPGPAPAAPSTFEEILEEFRERLAPHMLNAHNPRALPYFTPPALPISIAGELLAQWTNQAVDLWQCSPVASLLEEEVIGWLCDLVGYGHGSFGVLTSGGAMANLMALTVAREVHLPGLLGRDGPPRGGDLEWVRVYASDQTHFSVGRALDLLGFPRETLRVLPSDERFRLRGEPVAEAVAEDRRAGLVPFAVSAVTGSTNTGSVDPVPELAEVARREGMWLHVDAAYGGAVRLSGRDRDRVAGLELADTVTLDPHKWFFQPHDIGGLLVRRREDLARAFRGTPEYYRSAHSEGEPLDWYRYSIEGTRRFRALKLSFSWKFLGTEGFGRLIEHTLDLAAHLARRCRESEDLEAMPQEPELSVACFRHLPGGQERATGLDPSVLDHYQDRLQRALEVSGEGWLSTTRLRGRTYLRAGIVNYLTTREDIDGLLATLRRLSPAAARDAGIA